MQADPNYLWFIPFNEPKRQLTRAGAGSGLAAFRVNRIPSGHPEGYLQEFVTIYAEAARAINAKRKGVTVGDDVIHPTFDDGVMGVAFVEACVASSKKNGARVKLRLE
ncbi:GFO/IDH/MocA family oxidoreductase domain protein (plasmid) [Sinorhizobium sp. RAC02]|nr:GFO/IDH/MocA family oxidoreductase domain protein [Sinorhizobium sp. RAC02]